MTLAVLPLHRETTPSCCEVLRKHSMIPSYLRSRRPVLIISSCAIHRQQSINPSVHRKAFILGRMCFAARKTYLVLDEKLDTLNGSSSSLGDSGRHTTHCKSPQSAQIHQNKLAKKIHCFGLRCQLIAKQSIFMVVCRLGDDVLKKSIMKGYRDGIVSYHAAIATHAASGIASRRQPRSPSEKLENMPRQVSHCN